MVKNVFGGLSYEQGAAQNDKRRSTSASIRNSNRMSAFGSASRRQTVDQETHAHLRKMTIGLNEVKKEEVANKKIEKIVIGGSSTQRILYEFLPALNIIIQLCVLCNISLLIMPHVEGARGMVARNANLISCLEGIFVSAYFVEFLIKVFIYRWAYFVESWWDRIDFILVLISIFDICWPVYQRFYGQQQETSADIGEAADIARTAKLLRLLRSVRILRVIRALKWVKKLEQYITTIIQATRHLKPFMKLIAGLFVIFGIIGCSLFGRILPMQFGNMWLTLFTLLQLLTLDDWFEILQEGSVNRFNPSSNGESINKLLLIYLIAYIFVMSLVFLNLFIAVLVDEFQVSFEQAKYKESASASEQKNFLMAIDNMNLSEDESDDEFSSHDIHHKNHTDEFQEFVEEKSEAQKDIHEWYFKVLPALEKHLFMFEDHFATYERVVDEAIQQSDDLYGMNS